MRAPMIWPPSKATSMRTRPASSGTRHDLGEHAVDGVRVEERDLKAEHAAARLVVDQLGALLGQLGERRVDVRDLVGDVVHTGAAAGEELADRRALAGRREGLDP